jgi:UDP-N-acetylenolpyruvoylglucosamine reductase
VQVHAFDEKAAYVTCAKKLPLMLLHVQIEELLTGYKNSLLESKNSLQVAETQLVLRKNAEERAKKEISMLQAERAAMKQALQAKDSRIRDLEQFQVCLCGRAQNRC